jgi:peptidoglycan-associated lipoprotein
MLSRLKSLTLFGVVLLLTVSCASKKPAQEAPANNGAESGKMDPSVGSNDIGLDYDSATLSSETRKDLSDNAEWIKTHAKVTVQVEGHCDSRGSVEYNLALGERRAKAVKNYMVSLGIDGKRLTVISYGEEKPIATGDTEEAYAKNRRANFVPMAQ